LGTPTSGTLTNCTGLPIDGGTTGTLPVDKGGTGVTQSAYAESYISTSAATTYSATNTWYKISGSTSLTTGENFDDAGTNNRIRYTGTASRAFFITVCGTVTGSNGNTILVGLYDSGTSAHADASITAVTINGTHKHPFSSQAIVFLDTNDYIEVHTQNSSTSNATFERLNICAHALV
jgi:hypothetical protein